MANERLRSQLRSAQLTSTDLASALAIDPKTVDRWVDTARVPRQPHRARAAELLGVKETFLWPELLDDDRARAASSAEVLMVYPHRGAVPMDLWRRLVDSAVTEVDILVYAGLFLLDSHPDLPGQLIERSRAGLKARILLARPDSEVVSRRGEEEGIGPNLAARINLSLTYLESVIGVPGIEVRLHETVLYNSLYRFDDELLVNAHVFGSPAPKNPVLHLRRIEGGRLFDHYRESIDQVWESAEPLEAPLPR